MSFFDLSDGSNAKDTGKTFTLNPDIKPIPAGTDVLASCDVAQWKEYEGEEFISLRWSVMKPSEYENRKIFHKLKVFESDPKKADKHKRMLAAIDFNSSGKLSKLTTKPTNEELESALVNSVMVLKLDVWEINDKSGNWVKAVSPTDTALTKSAPKKPVKSDDDIGF